MKKKKLLFIIWSNSYGGGAEKQLTNLINNLDKNKYEIDMIEYFHTNIKPEKLDPNINELKPINNKVTESKIKREIINKLIYSCPWIVRKKYIRKKYDLEVSFNYLIPTFLLSKDRRVKTVSWIHGNIWDLLPEREPWLNKLQRKSFKNVDKIVAIATETKKSIETIYPEYKDKIEVIYNGYDFDKMIELSNEKVNFRKDKSIFEFLFCNRFDDNKNPLLLIESAKLLKKHTNNFHITFLGKGNLETEMANKIKKYNLEDNISIVGFVSNPYPYIKESDAVCITSHSEGFSTLIIEGMCFKKPYISTKGGVTEEIEIEKAGITANTPKDFSEAMLSLINDKNLYSQLSKNSYKAAKKYSLKNQVKNTEKLIDSYLNDSN